MTNLLALIGRDTQLKRTSACHGGEYSGPCPLCRQGTDRFKVWPRLERWACLGPSAGRAGCDRGGDAIQYLRERDGLSYREACDRLNIPLSAQPRPGGAGLAPHPLTPARGQLDPAAPLAPPNPTWQAHAEGWAARCVALLWSERGARARDYLHRRGLGDEVLRAFKVGYNPDDAYEDHAQWGLAPRGLDARGLDARGLAPCGRQGGDDGPRHIWLPRGITLPWHIGGSIWRLNVRRPLSRSQLARGGAKYIGPAGFANGLYNADSLPAPASLPAPEALFAPASLAGARPVVLVEGELDALTIIQACGEAVAAVATGSTAGARRQPWISRLAAAPLVLVAFDHDAPAGAGGGGAGAGDLAAAWWLHTLPNARRWQPPLHDINSWPAPDVVARWIAGGLARSLTPQPSERRAPE